MNDGWIKLYRKIQVSDIWENGEAFDRRSAWIDLLLMAAYCDKETMDGALKRGQIMTSMRRLGERWKWSRSKTMNFLNRLELLHMISLETDNKKTVITIVKYDDFQGERATEQTTKHTAKQTAKRPHIKNNNKYNNINNNSARARKPSTWSNIESEKQKRERDEFLEDFERHIVGG